MNNERGVGAEDAITYRVQATKEAPRERRGTQGQRLEPSEVVASTSSKLKISGFSISM
mgnify:FL=1